MANYLKTIEGLIKKSLEVYAVTCVMCGEGVKIRENNGEEQWVYPLLFPKNPTITLKQQIGVVRYDPLAAEELEVKAFSDVQLTLGEDFRIVIEEYLREVIPRKLEELDQKEPD